MSPQYLPDLKAPLVRVPDYAHSGRVQNHFTGFFFLPCLKQQNRIEYYWRRFSRRFFGCHGYTSLNANVQRIRFRKITVSGCVKCLPHLKLNSRTSYNTMIYE